MNRDLEALSTIRWFFRSGMVQALNWIAVGGALRDIDTEVVDYIPPYRSLAGTSVGMTFARWP